MANPNGSPTMKATKNPGKLNTSFWNTAFKEDGKPEKKAAPRKKRVKKKSKMANMWENKFEQQKKDIVKTSYNKTNPQPKKKIIKEEQESVTNTNNNNKTEDIHNNDTASNTNGIDPKPKTASKISALAGKININPMGMRGGLPPSLRKKREEQKEKGVELPEQDFARPLIPESVQRKPKKRTLDIISITNKEINERLREYLSISFQFDGKMILNEDILCVYLKDNAGIDLSSTEDTNKWESDILISATKEVFGDTVQNHYGYQLRAI